MKLNATTLKKLGMGDFWKERGRTKCRRRGNGHLPQNQVIQKAKNKGGKELNQGGAGRNKFRDSEPYNPNESRVF